MVSYCSLPNNKVQPSFFLFTKMISTRNSIKPTTLFVISSCLSSLSTFVHFCPYSNIWSIFHHRHHFLLLTETLFEFKSEKKMVLKNQPVQKAEQKKWHKKAKSTKIKKKLLDRENFIQYSMLWKNVGRIFENQHLLKNHFCGENDFKAIKNWKLPF